VNPPIELAASADALRALHRPGDPVVLPNAWDPPSARRLAAAGAAAIATTSAGVAWALGREDGERTPGEEMLAAVGRIARAVDVPVTADLESGYGLEPEALVGALLEAGAVGLNLEDTDHRRGVLADVGVHSERLAAVKEAGRTVGVDFVLNARVDVFLRAERNGDPSVMDEAVRRGRRYAAAGADCVYPIGVRGRDAIRRIVDELDVPVNVLAWPGGLGRGELAELGVGRISFGSVLMDVALDAAVAHVAAFRLRARARPIRSARW
jgi:2-methylisocitrate lyase-like PEP mutase family enzyme